MENVADRTEMLEDANGFLREMSTWNRDIAKELAKRNDLGPLTEDHWRIIEFVKDFYIHTGRGPSVVRVAKKTGLSRKSICELFPCGLARGAYRLAGLPRPAGCA